MTEANDAVDALLKVSRAYLPERIVYMTGAGGAVLLLLYITFVKLTAGFDTPTAVAIFGSGGMFASTAYGVLRAFEKTLDLTAQVLGLKPAPPAGPAGQAGEPK